MDVDGFGPVDVGPWYYRRFFTHIANNRIFHRCALGIFQKLTAFSDLALDTPDLWSAFTQLVPVQGDITPGQNFGGHYNVDQFCVCCYLGCRRVALNNCHGCNHATCSDIYCDAQGLRTDAHTPHLGH